MVLLALKPDLTPDEFCDRTRDFVAWLTELLETHPVCGRRGWAEHLEAYEWEGRDWQATLRLREGWQQRLASGDTQAVEELLEWAHMDDLDAKTANDVLSSRGALEKIDAGQWEDLDRILPNRIASVSKVYSTAALDS